MMVQPQQPRAQYIGRTSHVCLNVVVHGSYLFQNKLNVIRADLFYHTTALESL